MSSFWVIYVYPSAMDGVIFVKSRRLPQHINMGCFPGKKHVEYISSPCRSKYLSAIERTTIESE